MRKGLQQAWIRAASQFSRLRNSDGAVTSWEARAILCTSSSAQAIERECFGGSLNVDLIEVPLLRRLGVS
jgi:hypothetical protein